MGTILITGANRGIGLELVRQYSAMNWQIIATARDPAAATNLQALASANPDITVEKLDITDYANLDALAVKYQNQPIDVLLSNAARTPRYLSALQGAASIDFDEAWNSFAVNALGPTRLIVDFLPHVQKSAQKKIVVISSTAGSFTESPKVSMLYEYRTSKAALNMFVYTLSYETAKQGVTIVAISPGTVDTKAVEGEMGFGSDVKPPGAISPSESVAGIIKVIDNLTPAKNGSFLDYQDGRVIPW